MAISLQYAQPLFIEERPVGTWARYLVFGFLTLWIFIGMTLLLLMHWMGWRSLFSRLNSIIFLVILFELAIVFAVTLVKSITVVEPAAMQLRLVIAGFTLWKRTVATSDIQSVESKPSPQKRSVLQFQPGQVSFMTTRDNVLITVNRGPNLLIGSERVAELVACLNDAIKPATPPGPMPPRVAPSI